MSWFRHLLPTSSKLPEAKDGGPSAVEVLAPSTLRSRPSSVGEVSDGVKADLKRNISRLDGISPRLVQPVYELALRSIPMGDAYTFCNGLMELNIEGMTRSRAASIEHSLGSKCHAVIEREKRISLGITHAIWLYSGAACMLSNPSNPSAADARQNAAHSAANGKRFEVRKGLFLNGKWTWPGVEGGCKCASRGILPGLPDRK